jgi:hypothetical protein
MESDIFISLYERVDEIKQMLLSEYEIDISDIDEEKVSEYDEDLLDTIYLIEQLHTSLGHFQ